MVETKIAAFLSHKECLHCISVSLAPETSSFNATPQEDRLCLSYEGENENEVHLLFYCPVYEDIKDVL